MQPLRPPYFLVDTGACCSGPLPMRVARLNGAEGIDHGIHRSVRNSIDPGTHRMPGHDHLVNALSGPDLDLVA